MKLLLAVVRLVILLVFTVFVSTLEILAVPFHRTGKIFHTLARFHAHGVLALSGVKLQTEGIDRLDLSRNYVYVSNHASYFDIPAVLAGVPQDVRLVYKKELEKLPFFGWGLKLGRTYIAIDRRQGTDAMATLESTAKKIREGSSVLLFAEGTRSRDGKLQPFKRGPFNLAAKAGIPVVPVTLLGSHDVLPRGSWKVRPGTVRLVLDEPIPPPAAGGKEGELRLRDRVHEIITRNINNAGATPCP
jgi:1-acyl-sn-glycerol-3-phosphate acyltransferase